MLRKVKDLHGAALHARDGELGTVEELLFDDERWTVRYLVVDTDGWLLGRQVLISPVALGALDGEQHILHVNLTRDQVERSPAADTDKPVSRQWEKDYHDYYVWPYYWGGLGVGGYPGVLLPAAADDGRSPQQEAGERARDPVSARDHGDVHLRSTREVTGYGISARDGHLGHVEDFIVDDDTWRIRYLAVDTRDWWPGKKVLLPTDWIGQASWPDRTVTVDVTRDQVRNGPEWDASKPISPTFEEELSVYDTRQYRQAPDTSKRPTGVWAEARTRSS